MSEYRYFWDHVEDARVLKLRIASSEAQRQLLLIAELILGDVTIEGGIPERLFELKREAQEYAGICMVRLGVYWDAYSWWEKYRMKKFQNTVISHLEVLLETGG